MIDCREKDIANEIVLKEDECCLMLNLACYFPYSNPEVLVFDFGLGMEQIDDFKLNHRYPNKSYQTISRTYGRRVSKFGYPYIMKLKEQDAPILFVLREGIKEGSTHPEDIVTLVFPVVLNMTKEKPICEFSLFFDFNHQGVFIESTNFVEGGKIDKTLRWLNERYAKAFPSKFKNPYEKIIEPVKTDIPGTYLFEEAITPCPISMENFCSIFPK